MSPEEIRTWINVLSTADGACSSCFFGLLREASEAFPDADFRPAIEEYYEVGDYFERPLEDALKAISNSKIELARASA